MSPRSKGRRLLFFQRVDEVLGELEWAHGAHPVCFSYFAAPVPPFPYTVFYRKSDEAITIMGIFDHRSDLALIWAQLRDR
jgi:hypothetical protein